ncbi:LysM peptidoglycan-binding domain-containing protein, partial [Paenibacillus phytohabitans]
MNKMEDEKLRREMEVFRLEIQGYKLVKNKDEYTLVVFVESQMTEFSSEFGGHFHQDKKDLHTQVRHLVKEKFPHLPIKVAKVLAGSMLITTFYLGATASNVGAQTISGQTQAVGDIYTVKAGDTLYSIAKQYNVSVDSIKQINGLTSNMLFIGQQLRMPFFTYTVASGDTLYNIAKRYNTTVDQIRTTNQLKSDMLVIGQKLRIPQLQATSVPQPNEAPVTSPVLETTTYTVVAGDTLYGISVKLGTTVDEIKTLNNLTSNVLSIGQVLKVPGSGVTTPTAPEPTQPTPVMSTYTVAAGDTLYSISLRFGTTVSAIQAANNLTTTNLSIGQVLTIPGESTETVAPPVDTTAPSAPVLLQIPGVTTANQSNFTVSGTTEANALVTLTVTDAGNTRKTVQVKADGNGAFKAGIDVSGLQDGTMTITAIATDEAGNKSSETIQTIKKDTKIDTPTLVTTQIINS